MSDTVASCTPSIPTRRGLLVRALNSVLQQTHPVHEMHVAFDHDREGAGPTRNRAVMAVESAKWIAFIDDDDTWRPQHVASLVGCANDTGADLVYPWFDVVAGGDPFPQFEGQPWDPEHPHLFPICVLLRTEVAKQVVNELGGFPAPPPGLMSYPTDPTADLEQVPWSGDDWPFWLKVFDLGIKVVHHNERTWFYHHNSNNTSGLPSRW